MVAVAGSHIDPTRAVSIAEDRTIKVYGGWVCVHGRNVWLGWVGSYIGVYGWCMCVYPVLHIHKNNSNTQKHHSYAPLKNTTLRHHSKTPLKPTTLKTNTIAQVWDLKHGRQVQTILIGSTGTSLGITRDGAILASGHMDGALRLWDARSGKKARELPALHSGALTSVDVGLSGRYILTCAKDNSLSVIDVRMLEVMMKLQGSGFSVAGKHAKACLAPNEAHAAAGVGVCVFVCVWGWVGGVGGAMLFVLHVGWYQSICVVLFSTPLTHNRFYGWLCVCVEP